MAARCSAATSRGAASRSSLRPAIARPPRRATARCRASPVTETSLAQDAAADVAPPGCSRYTVSIKKPLGIVLEQTKEAGSIVVVEVKPDSNASRTGLIQVGDQLIATSGVTYTKDADYNGASVKMGQQVVRMTVQGQSFKTVSAAIGSHPGHMAVTLEFQRCGAKE